MTRLQKLRQIIAAASLEVEQIERGNGTYVPKTRRHSTSGTRRIIEAAAHEYGLTVEDILGDSRRRQIVAARWEAARRLREAGLSYPHIGELLNRHHTTVMHAVRSLEADASAHRVRV